MPLTGVLTSDNSYLSPAKPGLGHGGAVDCTDLPNAVASYVRASLADNTQRAYLSDLEQFAAWGGRPRHPRNRCRLSGRSRRQPQRGDPGSASRLDLKGAPSTRAVQSTQIGACPGDDTRHQTDPALRPA